MDIEQVRAQINDVDEQLSALFVQRMELCRQIAECKHAAQMGIRDQKRNESIFSRVGSTTPKIYAPYVHRLYETILEISRDYQRQVMIDADEKEAATQL